MKIILLIIILSLFGCRNDFEMNEKKFRDTVIKNNLCVQIIAQYWRYGFVHITKYCIDGYVYIDKTYSFRQVQKMENGNIVLEKCECEIDDETK